MSESDDTIEMTARRAESRTARGARITELATTLRSLAENQEDERIADWLDEVVRRVELYAESPTRDQMAGALGMAELGVHVRLDTILTGIQALQQAEQERARQFATFGVQLATLTSDVSRICELVADLDTRLRRNETRLDNQSALIAAGAAERQALASQLTALAEQFASMRRIVEELLSRRALLTEEQVRRYVALIEAHERHLQTMAGESGGGSGGA